MQKAFEDAAFALQVRRAGWALRSKVALPMHKRLTHVLLPRPLRQVGELSPPVFSDSGVHLVLRTAWAAGL